jgi:D-alanyl-D-alanine carboxypeptidase/D-alanyl-D-alanine-endopeptidase (penicillin-binding protein 4)
MKCVRLAIPLTLRWPKDHLNLCRRCVASLIAGFLLPGLAALPASGQEQRLPPQVARALRDAAIPTTGVSLMVQEVGAKRARLEFNDQQPMNPASLMKLVTTYAALELLGPAFTWNTSAYLNGSMQGDVLNGDLVLKGGGDPKLTLENLWLFVRNLRAHGLREVRGDLVLDRSYFEEIQYDPAQFDAEPLRPYNVGPDALLVNFKAFRYTFIPDLERRTVSISVEPNPPVLELGNSVKGVDGPCGDWKERLRADFQSNGTTARATFAGAYPFSCGDKTWNVSLLANAGYVGSVFRQLWEDSGGVLRGTVRDGNVPPTARLLLSVDSSQLAEIVRDINKYSNNVMARQLYLTLSAEMMHLPGATPRSAKVIDTWLRQHGFEFRELSIENGSGLSRSDRISAQHLGNLMLAAFGSPVMPELMASLPLVAYDGTMKKRLNDKGVAGQAHIKTGTLEGVKAIAGYVLDKNGKLDVVVFMINHPNAAAGQAAQDALLQWVYDAAPARGADLD